MMRFSIEIVVTQSDLDTLEHVNNVRYLEWVQDISGQHWRTLSQPDWEARYVWVVRSHSIRYFRPAVGGDRLLLATYVPEVRGALSERVVEISLADTGEKVAICRTEWCLLEKPGMRPVRVPERIAERLLG